MNRIRMYGYVRTNIHTHIHIYTHMHTLSYIRPCNIIFNDIVYAGLSVHIWLCGWKSVDVCNGFAFIFAFALIIQTYKHSKDCFFFSTYYHMYVWVLLYECMHNRRICVWIKYYSYIFEIYRIFTTDCSIFLFLLELFNIWDCCNHYVYGKNVICMCNIYVIVKMHLFIHVFPSPIICGCCCYTC